MSGQQSAFSNQRSAFSDQRSADRRRTTADDQRRLRSPEFIRAESPAAPGGAGRFKAALRRLALPPERGERPKAGSSWEVWIEYRVECLEDGQRWMQRVILGALILEVGLQVVQMVH